MAKKDTLKSSATRAMKRQDMASPEPAYTYVDAVTQEAVCPICQAHRKMPVPASVDSFADWLLRFGREHVICQPRASVNRDFLVVCATRYCLGRQSYVVSSMTRYLIQNAKRIHPSDRAVIIKDIQEQAKFGYGQKIDEQEWMRALRELSAMQIEDSPR